MAGGDGPNFLGRAETAADISPASDGKLWKEVVVEGKGRPPADGSVLFVHYVGSLPDGTEFDRSDRAGKPFSFTLGRREVIEGWEVALRTMSRGELAKYVIHPQLAYGESGSGKIPPNATLHFEIQLMDWKDEELTDDGRITRKIIKPGRLKHCHPNDGAECQIHLEGYHAGKMFEDRLVDFIMGEGSEANLVRGIEIALQKFCEYEKSELEVSPDYAYGELGNPDLGLPPNATLTYVLELKRFTKGKEAWSLDGLEKMDCAREFKAKGTKFFQEKKYHLAHRNYKKVIDFLKAEAMLVGDLEEERKVLLGSSYLNKAQCSLELSDYLDAKHSAEEGLELQPTNVKGWYRKALANIGLREPVEAKRDLGKVLELEPGNKIVQQKIHLCNKMIKEHTEKERNLYAKMIGAIN